MSNFDLNNSSQDTEAVKSNTRPWFKKKRFIIPIALVLVFGVAPALTSTSSNNSSETSNQSDIAPEATLPEDSSVAEDSTPEIVVDEPAVDDSSSSETASQAQARGMASDYLDTMSFSLKGLIKQLEFEGFSKADATYGANAVNADWNEQAAIAAGDYLDIMSFSRSGLIDQLVFDGYTPAQAKYGVSAAGL